MSAIIGNREKNDALGGGNGNFWTCDSPENRMCGLRGQTSARANPPGSLHCSLSGSWRKPEASPAGRGDLLAPDHLHPGYFQLAGHGILSPGCGGHGTPLCFGGGGGIHIS